MAAESLTIGTHQNPEEWRGSKVENHESWERVNRGDGSYGEVESTSSS